MGLRQSKSYKEGVKPKNETDGASCVHKGSILGVSSINTDNKKRIISCSDDNTIGVVSLDSITDLINVKENYEYLIGHQKAVNRVYCSNNTIFSISRDLSLKQVNIEI